MHKIEVADKRKCYALVYGRSNALDQPATDHRVVRGCHSAPDGAGEEENGRGEKPETFSVLVARCGDQWANGTHHGELIAGE